MVVLPLEGGKPVTMSSEMSNQGKRGNGRGYNSPPLRTFKDFWEHIEQVAAYLTMFFLIEGHQNCVHIWKVVLLTPG